MADENTLIVRIKLRIPGEKVEDIALVELSNTVMDRLCIRLGEDALPDPFQSICVDAVVKMHRRTYYEGILSEGAAEMSTSFVDNILSEYESEIQDWKERKSNTSGSGRKVSFL